MSQQEETTLLSPEIIPGNNFYLNSQDYYNQGMSAYNKGLTRNANPCGHMRAYSEWDTGYMKAYFIKNKSNAKDNTPADKT